MLNKNPYQLSSHQPLILESEVMQQLPELFEHVWCLCINKHQQYACEMETGPIR